MSWQIFGAGKISTLSKENSNTYIINKCKNGNGSFVTFKIMSRRYANNKDVYESILCKRYIKENAENFAKLLIAKRMVAIAGILEQYYNPENGKTTYSIMCTNVDFCGTVNENTENKQETDHFGIEG